MHCTTRAPSLVCLLLFLFGVFQEQAVGQDTQAGFSDSHAREILFGQSVLADNSLAIRRLAATTPDEERLEFLSRWILPYETHAGFRVIGEFVPTNPSPATRQDVAFHTSDSQIVSPVFDALSLARQQGKLVDFRERVESKRTANSIDLLAKKALLALVDLEQNDADAAEQSVASLHDLSSKIKLDSPDALWPFLLVAHRGMNRFPNSRSVGELVSYLYQTCVVPNETTLPRFFLGHLQALRAGFLDRQSNSQRDVVQDEELLANWIPIWEATASMRGNGSAVPQWSLDNAGSVVHRVGGNVDYLAFASPLSGEFSVEADLSAADPGQIQNAGRSIGPGYRTDFFRSGKFGGSLENVPLPVPMGKFDRWVHYRNSIGAGTQQVSLNGRLVEETEVSKDADPWLAMRCWYKSNSRFRDLRIGGTPHIPKQISLIRSSGLSGWNDYFGGSLPADKGQWKRIDSSDGDSWIVSPLRDKLPRSDSERLLRYFRPLVGDSIVEYEFYYQPGVVDACPALDRLAFAFTSDGVAEHWITDGLYDRGVLRPDNLNRIAANQRGGGKLPLHGSQWNHIRLEVQEDTLRIFLNQHLIYERDVDVDCDRTFGLFHFADQTELRVRRVTLQGNWPKLLPEPQKLADPVPFQLRDSLNELPSVFHHDFGNVDATTRYFNATTIRRNGGATETAGGLRLAATSSGPWKQLAAAPQFSMHGDFDVTADFSQAAIPESADMARVALTISLDDSVSRKLVAAIGFASGQGRHLMGSINLNHPDGTMQFQTGRRANESISGRLRIARREEDVYFLFAEKDSSDWRLLHHETASAAEIPIGGVQLVSIAKGQGTTSATWENLTLRAEKLMVSPSSDPKPVLSVVRIDGMELRDLAKPDETLLHVGSPEWSPDGTQIAYDQQAGTTLTARLMRVEKAGGDPVDLGFGSMPTFSPDGKQIAFSAARQGVGIMEADGSNRTILDPSGWGIQWSPIPNLLAYSRGGSLLVWDLNTSSNKSILQGPDATRYSYIYWNMSWSPDGKKIAIKGRRRDNSGDEVAIVTLSNPSRLDVIDTPAKVGGDMSWSSDSRRLLFPMQVIESKRNQLHFVDLDAPGVPKIWPNQPNDRQISGVDLSRDGKWLAITARPDPRLILWENESGTPSNQSPIR